MADDMSNALVAVLNGLARGVDEGLEIRRKAAKDEADLALKREELDIRRSEIARKAAADESKADYMSASVDNMRSKTQERRARAAGKYDEGKIRDDLLALDKVKLKLDKEYDKTKTELSYLKKPEQRAPFEEKLANIEAERDRMLQQRAELEAKIHGGKAKEAAPDDSLSQAYNAMDSAQNEDQIRETLKVMSGKVKGEANKRALVQKAKERILKLRGGS